MTYTDSEIARLLAESFIRPVDRYRIREEIHWLVNNSPELDGDSKDFYKRFFDFDENMTHGETLQ